MSEVPGGFFTTLTQAFKVDFDREVVRGHFEAGKPSETHRYYCLVDPKTGKKVPNAVTGQPAQGRHGMTTIKGGAVTPLSCEDAERKGLLVTTGYTVGGAAAGANTSGGGPGAATGSASAETAGTRVASAGAAGSGPAASPGVASASVASAGVAGAGVVSAGVASPSVASAAGAAAAPLPPAAGTSVDSSTVRSEVMSVYSRFIAGQNAHDRAAVSEVLLESNDFVWVQDGGKSVWGYEQALQAFQQEWKGTWRLDPQLQQVRIVTQSGDVAVLVTPLVFTAGDAGQLASTIPVRWSGVFVRTKSGWRISSIFITPFRDWRAPGS